MKPRLAAPALLLAAVGLSVSARSVELRSQDSASVALSGSLSQLGLYTHQTSASDFADAIAADLPATTCVLAATFANCPAFDSVGELETPQGLTRIRLRADLRATDWLSAVVVYDNEVFAGVIDTVQPGFSTGFELKHQCRRGL